MNEYTTGHCRNHKQPGGCQLHNVQCGYPNCDRKPVAAQEQAHPISSGHPDDAGFELWWSEHMPEAAQSVAINAWNAAQPTVQAQERKGLFIDMIAQHEGLAEELAQEQTQPVQQEKPDFATWWKKLKPAECDELKDVFRECWETAFTLGNLGVSKRATGQAFEAGRRAMLDEVLKIAPDSIAVLLERLKEEA